MPRVATKLSSDLAIRKVKPRTGQLHPISYSVAGGPAGLLLQVAPSGAKSWLFRATTGTRPHPTKPGQVVQVRRELGLGGYPSLSLQDAREKARAFRGMVASGTDPKVQRADAQKASLAAQARLKTFAQCEKATIVAKGPGYKNSSKSMAQWRTRMDLHVLPILGGRFIHEIESDDIVEVLEPLWHTKYPTAKKLWNDISAVFRFAKAKKLLVGENPASKDIVNTLLGKTSHKQKHFPSLPYLLVSAFMSDLRKRSGDGARALEFVILTAARSDEVRSAVWSEFDLKKKLWTIPGARMKRDRDHHVPLSKQAMLLLKVQAPKGGVNPFSNSKGAALSDMALSGLVKKMHAASIKRQGAGYLDPVYDEIVVPHGFRSSFKDWARNLTPYADEVSELALAHVNSDATRAAYARDELLALRAPMMQEWADYCATH